MSGPALLSETFVPERFGPYELRGHLGRGGMADVFKAREEKVYGITRYVVIKRILFDYCSDPRFVELFINEARIAAQLNHPNIAHIYDVGEIDGMLYICMEYVRGLDLMRVLHRAREHGTLLPPIFGAYVMRHIVSALECAHGHMSADGEGGDVEQSTPIVHRDVSPPNIMISKDGQIKLVDFGIAKAVSAHADASRTRAMKGKICYMAPEQLSHGMCTPQTDLFSAGIVLHEALTGQPLFLGATDYDTMTRVMGAPIPLPSSINPAVSPELDRIVLKALARVPEERYQRATDLVHDLDAVLFEARCSPSMVADYVHVLASGEDREGWLLGSGAPVSQVGPVSQMSPVPEGRRAEDDRAIAAAIVARAGQSRLRALPPPAIAPGAPPAAPRSHLPSALLLLALLIFSGSAGSIAYLMRRPASPAVAPGDGATSGRAKAEVGAGSAPGPAATSGVEQPSLSAALMQLASSISRASQAVTAPSVSAPMVAVPTPTAEPARIQLRTLPSGSMVYSGPRRLGHTPLLLVLKPGEELPLTLESDGRPDLRYTVRPGDAPEVVLRLPPPSRHHEARPAHKEDPPQKDARHSGPRHTGYERPAGIRAVDD